MHQIKKIFGKLPGINLISHLERKLMLLRLRFILTTAIFLLLYTFSAQADDGVTIFNPERILFTPTSGSFTSIVWAEAQVDGGNPDYNGGTPVSGSRIQTVESAFSENINSGDSADATAAANGSYGAAFDTFSIQMSTASLSFRSADIGSGSSFAQSYIHTIQGGGLFFQIDSDNGYAIGTSIDIDLTWFGSLNRMFASGTGSALLTGGSMWGNDDIAVTLNGETVWSHASIELNSGETSFNDSEAGKFTAEIGDIIGIHMGILSNSGGGPEMGFETSGEQILSLSGSRSSVPIPGSMFLLSIGLFFVGAYRIGKKNNR